MDDITKAVERAITTMHTRLGDKLTIDDLARAAMFSKFHFSRVFTRATGISPGRFLSALRIEAAKHLLLTTTHTVADIGHQVGYNSVGTFSSRFRTSVGVSPITYRQMGGTLTHIPHAAPSGTATLHGQLHAPGHVPGQFAGIFLALFPHRLPEGKPAHHTILTSPGPFHLHPIPPGSWHLTAHTTGLAPGTATTVRYTAHTGPITIHSDTTTHISNLTLHPATPLDPPHLLALPDLRHHVELDLAG